MAAELGCSAALVYAAFSVALIVAALTARFAGKYIDCWGGKKILAGSSLCFAASLFFLRTPRGPLSFLCVGQPWSGYGGGAVRHGFCRSCPLLWGKLATCYRWHNAMRRVRKHCELACNAISSGKFRVA